MSADGPPLPDRLETERLTMRQVTHADLAFLNELHGDPEVTRYLGGDGAPRPPEATREWARNTMRWYREENVGQYLVCSRASGEPLGRSGLSLFEIELTPTADDGIPTATWGSGSAAPGTPVRRVLEVGYTFQRSAWGQGFASEAARRWYEYALGDRGAAEAYSVIHEENAASIGVARKLELTALEDRVRMDGQVYRLFARKRSGPPESGTPDPLGA